MTEAVIFDMDGTILDTEAVYEAGWISAGVDRELYYQFIGRPLHKINEMLLDVGLDPDRTREKKEAYTENALKDGIPLKPGAEYLLGSLKEAGLKLAVATSSTIERAYEYLQRAGLDGYFDKITSGHLLERGKPAPDIFLIAAKELGAAPENCFVVEDSYSGVRAGKAAGMQVIMVPDRVAPDEEIRTLADYVLPDLNGAVEIIL